MLFAGAYVGDLRCKQGCETTRVARRKTPLGALTRTVVAHLPAKVEVLQVYSRQCKLKTDTKANIGTFYTAKVLIWQMKSRSN